MAQAKTAEPEAKKAIMSKILDMVAEELLPEAKVMVESIERKPETTQNHYGDYMAILSRCPDKMTQAGMAQALVMAGGNQNGVTSALDLI